MKIKQIRSYLGKYADNPTRNMEMTQREAGMLLLQIKDPKDAGNMWGELERKGKLTHIQAAFFDLVASLIKFEVEGREGAYRALSNRIKELKGES